MSRFHQKSNFENFITTKGINKNQLVKVYNEYYQTNHKTWINVFDCTKCKDFTEFHNWVAKMIRESKLDSNGFKFKDTNLWIQDKIEKKERSAKVDSEYNLLSEEAKRVHKIIKPLNWNTSQIKSHLQNALGYTMGVNNEAVSVFGKLYPLWEMITEDIFKNYLNKINNNKN